VSDRDLDLGAIFPEVDWSEGLHIISKRSWMALPEMLVVFGPGPVVEALTHYFHVVDV
jgi:hypothetical protein